MITLQNFITPEPGICTEQALYCHVQGPAGFSQSTGHYTLSRGACARFDTYFNLFSLGKWNRGCAFDTLFAELTGSGKAEIKITLAQPSRSWEVVYCDIAELAEDTPYQIDLSEFAGPGIEGVLYAEVLALGDEVTLTGGRFATAAVPDSLPQLAVSVEFARRRHHHGLADQYLLAVDDAAALQLDPALVDLDVGHLDLGQHHVAGAYGGEEFQVLTHVDGAMAGKLLADHCRDQPGGQHAMGNAPFKDRVLRIAVIQMHRVAVGGDLGKQLDVAVGDLLAQVAGHAHLDVFDADGAAGEIVQHPCLPEGFERQ